MSFTVHTTDKFPRGKSSEAPTVLLTALLTRTLDPQDSTTEVSQMLGQDSYSYPSKFHKSTIVLKNKNPKEACKFRNMNMTGETHELSLSEATLTLRNTY